MKNSTSSLLAIFVSMGATTGNAFADEQKQRLGMIAHAGRTSLTGDLSDEKSAPTWGLNILVHSHQKSLSDTLGGIQGFFLFDFASTKAKTANESKFPFTRGQTLTIGETALVPTVCALANSPVQACFGAGYMMLDLRDNHNKQTYGAFREDLRVGHYFGEGLIGGVEVHAYNVKQRVAGVNSSFTAVSYQAGLGWQW